LRIGGTVRTRGLIVSVLALSASVADAETIVDGTLLGTTQGGAVFMIQSDGTGFRVLHSFPGDAPTPSALILASDSSFYLAGRKARPGHPAQRRPVAGMHMPARAFRIPSQGFWKP
jgi:hypothetical protein